MSKIHLEIFDEKRETVFTQLRDFRRIGYLAGGTALALQLGHRVSYDFDVFIKHAITNAVKVKIRNTFGIARYEINTDDQVNFSIGNDVKVTFLWYYFPLLRPLVPTSGLPLASIEDIAADKAYTIGRRSVWRDYVDLFCLLRQTKRTLMDIIKLAEEKFSGEFNETTFLQQVSYFDDLTVTPIAFIGQKYTSEEIQMVLRDAVMCQVTHVLKGS